MTANQSAPDLEKDTTQTISELRAEIEELRAYQVQVAKQFLDNVTKIKSFHLEFIENMSVADQQNMITLNDYKQYTKKHNTNLMKALTQLREVNLVGVAYLEKLASKDMEH
jgi:hypothetical protein